jgi:PAS domain S-box-containing protein
LALLESSPVGVRIIRNRDSKIVYANARMGELFHLSKEEFLGTKPEDYRVDPTSQKTTFTRFKKEGFLRDVEIEMKRPDGSTFWTLMSVFPFEYEGEAARIVWLYEITNLKEAEEALFDSKAKLEEAQRIGRIGNWELDVRTGECIWSDEMFRIFNLKN